MRNRASQAGLLFAIGLVVVVVPALSATYPRDQLISDARQLAQVIEDTHPDPFVYCGGRIAYYRVFQEVVESIPEAGATLDEFVHTSCGR